jgi:hypothetical protein
LIPDFDRPFSGTSEENCWYVCIPTNVVNGNLVCMIGFEKRAVFGGTSIYDSFLGANKKKGLIDRVECNTTATIYN